MCSLLYVCQLGSTDTIKRKQMDAKILLQIYIYLIEYFSKLLKCFPGTSNDTGNAYDLQLSETGQIYNLI